MSRVLGGAVCRAQSYRIFLNAMIFSNIILEISYVFDVESIIFLFTVSLIRYSVFNFRYRYISADKEFNYFHLLLFTFVIRIVILIFSTNIIGMMLG